MNALTPIERAVLAALLSGNDPTLETLRAQTHAAVVKERERTTGLFVIHLTVPKELPRAFVPVVMLNDVVIRRRENGEYLGQPTLWIVNGAVMAFSVPDILASAEILLEDIVFDYWALRRESPAGERELERSAERDLVTLAKD